MMFSAVRKSGFLSLFVFVVFLLFPVFAFAQVEGAGEPSIPEDEEIFTPPPVFNPLFTPGKVFIEAENIYLNLRGQLQVYGLLYSGENSYLKSGDPAEKAGFRIRRARLGFEGAAYKDFYFNMTLELYDKEEAEGTLLDAYIDYTSRDRLFGLSLGAQKFPFSKGYLFSSSKLLTVDRPFAVRAMAPGRALGLLIHSEPLKDTLYLGAGVFNGLLRGATFHEGYDEVGMSLGNRYEQLAYAGRFDFTPLGDMGGDVADLEVSDFKFGVGGGMFYNDADTNKYLGFSGDLHLKFKGIALFGEVLWDRAKPSSKPAQNTTLNVETDRLAFYINLAYTIFPNLLTVGAKYEYLDDNMDVKNQGDERIYGGNLNFHLAEGLLKFQIEYTHRSEQYGGQIKNDTVLSHVQFVF